MLASTVLEAYFRASMKLKAIWGFALATLLSACSTDLDINSTWKEITLAHALLDPNDTTHYIRITKGFLDPSRSALEIARIGDSIRYSSLDVMVERWKNGNRVDTFRCLPATNVPKDSGVFAFPEQNVFSFTHLLDAESEYRLKVKTPLGNQLSASTNIVRPFRIYSPQLQGRVSLLPAGSTRVGFTAPVAGKSYQLVARLHYLEGNRLDSRLNYKNRWVDMTVVTQGNIRDVSGTERIEHNLLGRSILNALNGSLAKSDTIGRIFLGVEFIIICGNETLTDYININQPVQAVNDIRPVFTNIQNGMGIFASRTTSPNLRNFMARPNYPVMPNMDPTTQFREVDAGPGYDTLVISFPQLGFRR